MVGRGFVVSKEEARKLGLGEIEGLDAHIKPYRNGRDLSQQSRELMVIDLYGLEADEVREQFPAVYQHVVENVKPEREARSGETADATEYAENWWLFAKTRPALRSAISDLDRYIATPYVSKHRFFQFLDSSILPDDKLVNIALDDAYALGVLSSRVHTVWSLAAGGNQGVGNDPVYNNTRCFDPFPFPAATDEEKATIRELGEQLDRHRKEQLDAHEGLTMTALYNVLKKEQSGGELTKEEREIHEKGPIGVLAELHDELDAAVARAYGWEPGLEKEEILQRLVDLNEERRAEEEEGHVRWLRPEYQAPEDVETQAALDLDVDVSAEGEVAQPLPWPSQLKERAQAIRAVMDASEEPLTVEEVAQHFHHARRKDVRDLLETLAGLGLVDRDEEEYVA